MVAFARASLFSLCVVHSLAGSTPVANVRLSPPASLPGIGEELRSLEDARQLSEIAGFEKLDVAFREAIRNAESRIGNVVANFIPGSTGAAHSASFVAVSAGDGARASHFRLKVAPVPAPSRVVKQRVKLIERVRAAQEDALISQGARELQLLVDVVIGELSLELAALKGPQGASSGVGFLQSRGADGVLDVRFLSPDVPFPTIATLVQATEDRRAESERTVRERIAEVQLKLLHSLNSMVENSLRQRLASS